MNNGHISIHRKMLDWEWWDDINTRNVFFTCLLLSNWKDKLWKGKTIKRGSFITSLDSLAKKTGISTQSLRTSINKLKSTNELTSESTNVYTVISIKKYEKYQVSTNELTNEQQTTNKRLTTTNKDNKDNKDIYIQEVFSFYQKSYGSKAQLLPARVEKIKGRLKNFTVEQIKEAITKAGADDFWSGQDFDFIFRSDVNMDRMLNLKPKKANKPTTGIFASLAEDMDRKELQNI